MSRFTDRIDMRFLYTPSSATDIRKTFNRIRRQLAEQKALEEAKPKAVVKQIRKEQGK